MEIRDIVDRLKLQRNRDSTCETCHRIWKRFNKFFLRLDDEPNNWEDRITLFLGHLIGNFKLQSATIKTYMSAIKCVLAEIDVKLNHDDFLISSLTRACKIRNDTLITRLPIHKKLLKLILDKVMKWADSQPYLLNLYAALFSAAYYGLLRTSEVT